LVLGISDLVIRVTGSTLSVLRRKMLDPPFSGRAVKTRVSGLSDCEMHDSTIISFASIAACDVQTDTSPIGSRDEKGAELAMEGIPSQ